MTCQNYELIIIFPKSVDESSVHLQMNRSGPESVGGKIQERTRKWEASFNSNEQKQRSFDFRRHPGRGRDRMVVGFTITYAINVYHH